MNTKKKLLLAGLITMISITSILVGVVLQNDKSPLSPTPDVTITLTENGFEPEQIAIKKGNTVQFKTTRETYFWPASNLHPTHELYAAFDPQEPIAPEDTWNFTFDELGQWQFHDHLAPYYTGTITVTE